jgi:hypothetical protein
MAKLVTPLITSTLVINFPYCATKLSWLKCSLHLSHKIAFKRHSVHVGMIHNIIKPVSGMYSKAELCHNSIYCSVISQCHLCMCLLQLKNKIRLNTQFDINIVPLYERGAKLQ